MGCQVERKCMKSDSNVGAQERALTEPLDIYFTILHCCKTKTETEREGERREVVGERKKISPRSYFPHSSKLQAAQLHYTCTEQSVWQRFTKRRNTLSLTA